MVTYCLSIHAPYACRHSGACCSEWQVPAEAAVVEVVTRHGLGASDGHSGGLFERGDEGTLRIAHSANGTCVFRKNQRCEIHSAAGERSLPVACRHYPRVVLRDGRGTLVSLSHYCPTAASLLDSDHAVRVVDAPPPLILQEPIEGLDARDELPPLVRPGVLTDIDGYAAWEGAVIEIFQTSRAADRAFRIIEAATDQVRQWNPARGSLTSAVNDAFETARGAAPRRTRRTGALGIVADLLPSERRLEVPSDLEAQWCNMRSADVRVQRIIANYLSARAFGNWVAYQGHGLQTVVAWLRACYDVLRLHIVRTGPSRSGAHDVVSQAVRDTDLVMLHTIDSATFAHRATALETQALT